MVRMFLVGTFLDQKNNYLLQLPQKLQLQPSIDPTLRQQLNLQLQLQLQLHRRTTVHWPTREHLDGGYTTWNGYCLMRGLVGQDKSYVILARARGAYLRARARLRLSALARACARAFAPTVAGACRDMTSLGPSSFRDHVVGVITQSPSQQMPSWWQLYFLFTLPLPIVGGRLVLRAVNTTTPPSF